MEHLATQDFRRTKLPALKSFEHIEPLTLERKGKAKKLNDAQAISPPEKRRDAFQAV